MSSWLKQGTLHENNRTKAERFSVMQRADDPDIERANRQLKDDLRGGATSVALVFEGAHNSWGYGLPAKTSSFDKLFDGIDLSNLHIRVDNHPHGQALTEAGVEFLQKKRIDPRSTRITFGTDPIATLATTGRLKMSLAAFKASLPQFMSTFFSSGLPGVVLEADGRPFHNAGASLAQEIGAMLAVARSHLEMVESGRHHIAYALPHIGFSTALDQDPAQGIAKLHVLQMLWHKLQKEYDITAPISAPIHIETSMYMMTKRDSLTNITRTSAAAFAAITGGASSLSVLPYSLPLGLPDREARRQARNTSLVFLQESSPTELLSGSALLPNAALVEKLATAAWDEFQIFEKQGGILNSLVNGSLQRRINEAQELRISSLMKHEQNIIGTSAFQDQIENSTAIYEQAPHNFQAQGIEHCKPLSFNRLDEIFEEARANAPGDI